MRNRPVKKDDESPINPKFKLGRSISSANISSKNGYLFLKRNHGQEFYTGNNNKITENLNFSNVIESNPRSASACKSAKTLKNNTMSASSSNISTIGKRSIK